MSGGTSTTREVKQRELFLGLTIFVLLHPIHCSEVCSELGGFLPHDYSGYSALSGYGYGDEWHWVGYGADETRYRAFLANRLSLECHNSPQHPPPQVLGVPALQVAGGGPGLPLLHAALLRLPAPPRLPPAAAEREAAGLQAEAEDGLLRRHGPRAGGRAAEAEDRLQKQCVRWQRVQFAGKIEPLLELALNLY